MKAKLDYQHKNWPHTAHILDFLRCAVIFDNVTDFIKGFTKFESNFTDPNFIHKRKGCIKQIVRIKNDFGDIKDESWNLDLNSFNYCDIKCNVIIEYNKQRLIGDLVFILLFVKKNYIKNYQKNLVIVITTKHTF